MERAPVKCMETCDTSMSEGSRPLKMARIAVLFLSVQSGYDEEHVRAPARANREGLGWVASGNALLAGSGAKGRRCNL